MTTLFYLHTQSTPATVWTVDHNLGHKPVVDVVVTGLNKMMPVSVVHVTDNQVEITFSQNRTGFARLV